MESKAEACSYLSHRFCYIGGTIHIRNYQSIEKYFDIWKEVMTNHGGIKPTNPEPYTPFQNREEFNIQESKKPFGQMQKYSGSYIKYWYFFLVY